ncbi:MAG: alpha/beta hydrolase [Clostridia bacterium]|nr:alpha/beta hydrolase [Clostridia bacterium]
MKKKKLISLIIGIAMIVSSFVCFLVLNIPTVSEATVSFDSKYKDADVVLKGSYWEVDNSEYAVLICPGYSCDRQKWRPMANLLVSNGFTTMSFDYSGQGASLGQIGFDNAKTDAIPVPIDDAIEFLHSKSGIAYDHIILLGHSMGGRSIMRLLYDYNSLEAITKVSKKELNSVIVFSPEVNYNFNAQASLFAGTSDANESPWDTYNATYTKGTNVYIFGSTADDTVREEDCLDMFEHIGGLNVPESGKWFSKQVNEVGSTICVGITGGVLHSYQMYAASFGSFLNEALTDITGHASTYPSWSFHFVYVGWFLALAGILLTLLALNMSSEWVVTDSIPSLINIKQFLLRKLLLWLPGILIAFLVCCVCVVMPFGSPVMNIPYMCFIAGYGLLMFFLYKKGKVKGTEGTIPKISFKITKSKKSVIVCAIICVAICFFVWYVLRSTMYRLIPFNFRLFWVVFATILMSFGYFVSGCETDMLESAGATKVQKFLYNLVQYVPLFLFVSFYLIIGSYSGLIGQAQNMVLMYIFCIPIGNYIKKQTGNRLYGALSSAFLFQTLMITSAALISFF